MTKVVENPEQFIVIGENIHATRVLLRNGRRATTLKNGTEVVPFKNNEDEPCYLTVPEWYKDTQPYRQGHIKHFIIALMKGIDGSSQEQQEGSAYLSYEVRRQVKAGASYIDINVDEIHYDLEIQKKAMCWAVETVQNISPVPPSIDSSNSEIIAEGLAAYNKIAGRPILNSVAIERPETKDMATQYGARVIVMSTSGEGMPQSADERVENATRITDQVLETGISLEDIFIDGTIFPISVDSQNGNHYFDAVRKLREIYGEEIHIGMGLSNISFGMPNRKLINETFIHLALEAGIDAGILDPVATKLRNVVALDTHSEKFTLASEMLLGRDEFCMNYISAFRDGKLN